MLKSVSQGIVATVIACFAITAGAETYEGSATRTPSTPPPAEVQSLDEQVQAVKSDVLAIAAELSLLEEELLFPSNSQVSLFVAHTRDETFRLDAIDVRINGNPAMHHIYNFKELDALHNGGIQRLYTGNLSRGAHSLEIQIIGKVNGEHDFASARSFEFTKDIDPRALEIAIAGPTAGKDAILLREL